MLPDRLQVSYQLLADDAVQRMEILGTSAANGVLTEVLATDCIDTPGVLEQTLQLILKAEIERLVDEVKFNLNRVLSTLALKYDMEAANTFAETIAKYLDELKLWLGASPIKLSIDGSMVNLELVNDFDAQGLLHALNSIAILVEMADEVIDASDQSLENLRGELKSARAVVANAGEILPQLAVERANAAPSRRVDIDREKSGLVRDSRRAEGLIEKKGSGLSRREATHSARIAKLAEIMANGKVVDSKQLFTVVRELIAFVKKNNVDGSEISGAEERKLRNVQCSEGLFDLEIALNEFIAQQEPLLETTASGQDTLSDVVSGVRAMPPSVQVLAILALMGIGALVLRSANDADPNERDDAVAAAMLNSQGAGNPGDRSFSHHTRMYKVDAQDLIEPRRLHDKFDRGMATVVESILADRDIDEALKERLRFNSALYDHSVSWSELKGRAYNALDAGKATRYWFAVADPRSPSLNNRTSTLFPDYNSSTFKVVRITPFTFSDEWAGILALAAVDLVHHVGSHNPLHENSHFHRKLEFDQSMKLVEYADAYLKGGIIRSVDELIKGEVFESLDDVFEFVRKGDFQTFAEKIDVLPGNVPFESEAEKLSRWAMYAKALAYRYIDLQGLEYEEEMDEKMWALMSILNSKASKSKSGELAKNSTYSIHTKYSGERDVVKARDTLREFLLSSMIGLTSKIPMDVGTHHDLILPVEGVNLATFRVLERVRIGDTDDGAIFSYEVYVKVNGFEELSGIFKFDSEMRVVRIP